MPATRVPRLPKRHVLGPGYIVKVVEVAPDVLRHIAGDAEKNLSAGVWSSDELTIYIDKSVSRDRKWAAYRHELLHAVHDVDTIIRGGI